MAYCVHCGVKLGEAEKSCPLCGTEAIDPSAPFDPQAPKPFPVRTPEQTLQVSKRYAVTLLSLLLLIPAAACVVIDLIGGGISWSIYPSGVLVLLWIALAVPLLFRKHRLYSTVLVTAATTCGYLYMVERLSGGGGWFLPIVLPALALSTAMICFTIWLIRSKRLRILRLGSVFFIEVGLLCFVIEMLCYYSDVTHRISWSPFVVVPCLFIALVLYVLSTNGPISTELKRRFHF